MRYFKEQSIVIKQICSKIEPGKKMLQKLMYLIERRGFNLDLNYSIHYFGPYSAKLDNVLRTLELYDEVHIDTKGSTHKIKLGEEPIEGELPKSEQEKVDFVLDIFLSKTALELEAITTIDYVAHTMLKNYDDEPKIIEEVKHIKGDKFSDVDLLASLHILKEIGILSNDSMQVS